MGLLDFVVRTAVRTAMLPVAIVHDVVTLPARAYDDKPGLTGRLLKDEAKDVKDTIDNPVLIDI